MRFEHGTVFNMEFMLAACRMNDVERSSLVDVFQPKLKTYQQTNAVEPEDVTHDEITFVEEIYNKDADEDVKELVCKACPKIFFTDNDLNQHIMWHNGASDTNLKVESPQTPKKSACDKAEKNNKVKKEINPDIPKTPSKSKKVEKGPKTPKKETFPRTPNKSSIKKTTKTPKKEIVPRTPRKTTVESTPKTPKKEVIPRTPKKPNVDKTGKIPKESNIVKTPKTSKKENVPKTPKKPAVKTGPQTPMKCSSNKTSLTTKNTPKTPRKEAVPKTPKKSTVKKAIKTPKKETGMRTPKKSVIHQTSKTPKKSGEEKNPKTPRKTPKRRLEEVVQGLKKDNVNEETPKKKKVGAKSPKSKTPKESNKSVNIEEEEIVDHKRIQTIKRKRKGELDETDDEPEVKSRKRKSWPCDPCDLEFPLKRDLTSHTDTEHKPQTRRRTPGVKQK